MLLTVFGRMLDNGGSLTRGFKDEWNFRSNKKHFQDNIVQCQNLLSNSSAYFLQSYDIFGDLSLDITIFSKQKIITYTIKATYDKSRNPFSYSTSSFEDYKEKDYDEYWVNTIAAYRKNLGTTLKLYSKEDKNILIDIKNSLLQEKYSDYYLGLQNNMEEFILELEKQIF